MLRSKILLTLLISLIVASTAFSLDTPTLVSPADGTSNVDPLGDITPTWNSVEGATAYTVELWFADGVEPIASVEVEAEEGMTQSLTLPIGVVDVYEEDYAWRVQATDGETTSEFSEIWTFETSRPGIPELVSPADGTTGVDQSQTITAQWNSVPYVDEYSFILLDDNVQILQAFVEDDGSGTFSLNVEPGTITEYNKDFRWLVVAIQDGQSSSPLWEGWEFETQELPAVQLISPEDQELSVPITPTFEWSKVMYADDYELTVYQMDENGDPVVVYNNIFPNEDFGFGETATYTLPEDESLLYYNFYYWTVTVYAGEEEATPESNMFRTIVLPEPTLVSPEDGSMDVAIDGPFVWDAIPGAEYYTLRIWNTEDGTLEYENTVDATDLPIEGVIEYTIPMGSELQYDDSFEWNIEAGIDDEFRTSVTWSFSTVNIPATTYIMPMDEATDVTMVPSPTWNAVYNAEAYIFTLYDAEMNELLTLELDAADYEGMEEVGFDVPDELALDYLTMYYWDVVATQNDASSVNNPLWSFTTGTVGGPLEVNLTDKETCFNEPIELGDLVGEVLVSATGGTGDYSFTWFPSIYLDDATSANPTNLSPRSTTDYFVIVEDNETGEEIQLTVTLTVNPAPNPDMPLFAREDMNTPVNLMDYIEEVKFGVAPFEYRWVDNDGFEIEDPNIVPPIGISRYYLTVTDANGCVSREERLIIFVSPLKETGDFVAGQNGTGFMVAYPTPVVDDVNVFAEFADNANITATVYSLTGEVVFTQNLGYSQTVEANLDLNNLSTGSYMLELSNGTERIIQTIIKN